MPKPRVLVLGLALWLAAAAPAFAHKMKAFATAQGAEVTGYAYFAPGGRAREVTVTVTTPDGETVSRSTTDNDGNFAFTAKTRADHLITVDGGDGHIATFTLPAGQLPESLAGERTVAPSPVIAPTPAAASPLSDDGAVERAVARQIRPLREQLDAYQEKVWMHDILGGLGVIAGIGGVAFGWSERRRRMETATPAKARSAS